MQTIERELLLGEGALAQVMVVSDSGGVQQKQKLRLSVIEETRCGMRKGSGAWIWVIHLDGCVCDEAYVCGRVWGVCVCVRVCVYGVSV